MWFVAQIVLPFMHIYYLPTAVNEAEIWLAFTLQNKVDTYAMISISFRCFKVNMKCQYHVYEIGYLVRGKVGRKSKNMHREGK